MAKIPYLTYKLAKSTFSTFPEDSVHRGEGKVKPEDFDWWLAEGHKPHPLHVNKSSKHQITLQNISVTLSRSGMFKCLLFW